MANDLHELGYSAWYDHLLDGGKEWWEEILNKIRECDVFLYAITEASLQSTACILEFRYAVSLQRNVLPIALLDQVHSYQFPPDLATLQVIEYQRADKKAAMALARALLHFPLSPALPMSLPAQPSAPISELSALHEAAISSDPLSLDSQAGITLRLRPHIENPREEVAALAIAKILLRRKDITFLVAQQLQYLIAERGKATQDPRSAPAPVVDSKANQNGAAVSKGHDSRIRNEIIQAKGHLTFGDLRGRKYSSEDIFRALKIERMATDYVFQGHHFRSPAEAVSFAANALIKRDA